MSRTTHQSPVNTSKLRGLLQLIRFDKPIGTLLLLWPTLWALWLAAPGIPSYKLLAIFCAGTFLTRSAGCIINDISDRNFDGAVARTKQRPLVTGVVSVKEAAIFCACLLLLAFVLVLLTNTLTVLLSLIAVLLTAVYPLLKRFTHMPQVVLGAAFAWGIPMAFAATNDSLPNELWLIFIASLLWTLIYDTQYAMADREDDIKIGLKSTAILFGDADRVIIGAFQCGMLIALATAANRFDLGLAFYMALGVVAVLFIYQQYLIRNRDSEACFKAFLHNNWVGLCLFVGIFVHYQGIL